MKTVNVGVFRTGCRRAKRIWLWGIIAPVGIAVGCNGGGKKLDVLETPGQSESALHNGAPAGVGMEDLHAVGMLRTPVSERCSGSLIGPDTMITAAHCLYPLSTGCGGQVAKPEDTYVVFADAHGNADGPGAQTIRVVGYAVHPLAWADRVTRCPDPDPPYVSCPTIPFARFLPSCNMVEVCGDRAADLGMRWEHDIALVYLESAPIGIEPLPVITSSSYNAVAPWVDNFLIQQQPYVTQVGYGDGSTDWSAPFPFERGRDMGTSMVVGIQETLFRHEKCGMQDFDQVTVPAIIVSRMSNPESYIDHGDSGGPLLVGPGPVAAGMVSPTGFSSLPSNTLEQRRHILGVASRGGNLPIVGDIPCSGPVDCPNEMVCLIHNFAASGFCARTCMDQSDCVMPGGGCYRPNPPDPGVCIGRFSYYAPTYIPENGDWIQAALDRNDIDLDGKPNHLDNCPGLPNPDQTNSNIDAEQDRQAVALGNACDPVPSPKFRIENMDKVPIGVQMGGCWLTGRYRGIQPTIIPEFTGSHNLINGAEVAQQNQVTEFRFCTPDAMQSRTCKVEHDQRRDIHFDIVDGPDEIWRTVTLTELGPKGASGLYDYPHKHKPNVSGYLTWDYWADIYEWVGDGWITSGIAIKPPNTEDHHWYRSSELVGTLGIRGGGPKSATLLGTIDNWTNGVHISPDLNDGYAMGQGIARSYDTVAPDPMDTIRGNKCAYCLGSCKPFVFDIAQLREYHKQLVTNPPNWMNKFDKTVLLNGPNGWGYVDSDGVLVETPGLIGYGLDSALTNQNHVYVPAAEPFKAQGGIYGGLTQGVLLNDMGTAIVDSVLATNTGYTLQGINIINGGDGPRTQALVGIPPRHGYAAIFSRTFGGIFIVGGWPLYGGYANDIWVVPEGAAPAQLIVPNYQPEYVLAATLTTVDHMLWILDQQPSGPNSWSARLVRINPKSLAHEVVWEGPKHGRYEQYWLSVDRDGQILLVGSSLPFDRHVTVRLKYLPFSLGTTEPEIIQIRPGALVGPPVVDSRGYVYLVSGAQDEILPLMVDKLVHNSQQGMDLGSCF